MKPYSIILASALALCACTQIRTDYEKYGLNCKAREVSLQSDKMEFPYTAWFNGVGQLDSVITFNFDGSFRSRETYSYGSRNRLEEIVCINSENETEARYEYEIDGKFVRECRIYGMNNQEIHRWIHRNDGRHILTSEYYGEGEFQYKTEKAFNGNHYTEKSYNPDGELLGSAEVDFYKTETKPSRIVGDDLDVEIKYNEKGLPVECRNVVLNSLGELEWIADLEINPKRFYTYEYDERGNWISRAERVHPDSAAVAVLRRTIVY